MQSGSLRSRPYAKLRADAFYTGLREEPPSSDDIDALVDEFMEAANQVFPGVCVHFEDWKGVDAIRFLARYKDKYLVLNDDIQGMVSVTIIFAAYCLSGLYNAFSPTSSCLGQFI